MKLKNLKKVNIIVFSTSKDRDDIDKALELGKAFYAVKPDTFDGFKSFVRKVLEIDWLLLEKGTEGFRLF